MERTRNTARGIWSDTQSATTRGIVTGTIFTAKDVVKEASGYNPSVTSLRTGATSPCTGEAFSSADRTRDEG